MLKMQIWCEQAVKNVVWSAIYGEYCARQCKQNSSNCWI